ncbi:MAG: TIGR04282 family arsenosugar biosynthesis glycosyltransferase, partial [Flavobacterium sp.]|nr:TIGR04282 family arsenosugar biosynthesis glycosyltransferase [Flavobacterium sp.]
MNAKKALIILTKNPELGKVKTRLAKTIGDEKALEVYKKLVLHTYHITANLNVDKFVFYSDNIEADDIWDANLFIKALQQGSNLGDRMNAAFEHVFNLNYKSVCIIGSDCYELNADIIDTAFSQLEETNCVIGPTFDGGYYLLGLNNLQPELFKNIEWSTETVFDATVNICKKLQ